MEHLMLWPHELAGTLDRKGVGTTVFGQKI